MLSRNRIIGGPKEVVQPIRFIDHTRQVLGKAMAGEAAGMRTRLRTSFYELQDAIEAGRPVPIDFYSRRVDEPQYVDALLQTYGIMHLHLGGRNSNVLVYLVQFNDSVLLLQINDHKWVTYRNTVARSAENLLANHGREIERHANAPGRKSTEDTVTKKTLEPEE